MSDVANHQHTEAAFGEGDRADRGLQRSPAWSVQRLVPVKQTDKDGRAQRLAEVMTRPSTRSSGHRSTP